MIILLKDKVNEKQVKNLTNWLEGIGFELHISTGQHQTIIGLIGDTSRVDMDLIASLDIVESVKRIQEPFKSANRKFHEDDSVVDCGGVPIGGGNFQIIAGPCSVETREQIISVAQSVKASGAGMLRGGAFKPRTSPYALQGLHEKGLELLLEAKKANRKFHEEPTVVDVAGRKFGGGNFQIIAGPCSVENEEQIVTVARA
ncbi:MAG: hypothetical protein IJ769_09145, partial [Clostridia bacterium]|nr:hypothetical protein [Clostridia bacterium]